MAENKKPKVCLFPIREIYGESNMNKINPFVLPHFCRLTTEDLDTFMFEFSIVWKNYDYTIDDQRLKIFPSTLNDATIHWFNSLERETYYFIGVDVVRFKYQILGLLQRHYRWDIQNVSRSRWISKIFWGNISVELQKSTQLHSRSIFLELSLTTRSQRRSGEKTQPCSHWRNLLTKLSWHQNDIKNAF